MKRVTVKFGVDEITRSVPESTTVGQMVLDSNVKATLGFGDNVRMLVNGVEMPKDAVIEAESIITVETRCNTKAVLAL